MIPAKNCETVSKFVKVRPRILWPLFSGHGVYKIKFATIIVLDVYVES